MTLAPLHPETIATDRQVALIEALHRQGAAAHHDLEQVDPARLSKSGASELIDLLQADVRRKARWAALADAEHDHELAHRNFDAVISAHEDFYDALSEEQGA